MNRDALKFSDLNAFRQELAAQGLFSDELIQDLFYEDGQLPYRSIFLIPLQLLPPAFDLDQIDAFDGQLTCVEDTRFLGHERYTQHFMIYRQSMTGYLEVQYVRTATNFATQQREAKEMAFVISVDDGGGQEFFLTDSGDLVSMHKPSEIEPRIFKTNKQVRRQEDLLRQKFPSTCRVYGLERKEFKRRWEKLIRQASETNTPTEDI